MKNNRRIFSVLIFLIITIIVNTVMLSSCNKKNNDSSQKEGNTNSMEDIVVTSEYLLQNGECNYKIVVPTDADSNELTAGGQLQILFKEATGLTLPIIKDSEIASVGAEDKYFLIGENAFAVKNNMVPKEVEVKSTGYTIKTKDKSVYIAGGRSVGTLFGVYRLLNYMLNYDYFAEGIYSLKKGVTKLSFNKYDVKVIPDCEYNSPSYRFLTEANLKNYSMYNPKGTAVRGKTGHGSIYYTLDDGEDNTIIKAIANHPKWFSEGIDVTNVSAADAAVNESAIDAVAQLCYNARGDAEEYEKLYKRMAQNIIDVMITDENAIKFNCSVMDNHKNCECSYCLADKAKYNTPSGAIIKLLNKVIETVDGWMASDNGKPHSREWSIMFYAYNNYQNAPAKYNGKEFEPIDETVICNKRLIPQVCYVGADYTSPMESKNNEAFKAQYDGWRCLAEVVSSYFYAQYYNYYLIPYNMFGVLSNQYKYLKGDIVHFQTANDNFATGFGNLRIYLCSKLGVDVNANVEEYIEKYFKNVYLDAGDVMYNLFNEYRTNEQRLKSEYPNIFCANTSCYQTRFVKSLYYESTLFDKWRGEIETALQKIEYLKDVDANLYKKVYKMIIGERIWVNYFYWQTNHTMMTYDTLESVTDELIHDIEYCSISYTREGPYEKSSDFIMELQNTLEGAR